MSHQKKQEHHLRPYKIAAQSAGLIVCIFTILLFAGLGTPEVLKMDQHELIPFVPLLLLAGVGYLLTWYKELTGAIIMVAGGVLLFVFFLTKGDARTGLLYGLPFIFSGGIFLMHINKRTQLKRKL